MSKYECGGCLGMGSHSRWCPEARGQRAHILGTASEQLEDIGDRIGPVAPDLANTLYAVAASIRTRANEARLDRE